MLALNDETLATLAETKAVLKKDQAIQEEIAERFAARNVAVRAWNRVSETVVQGESKLSRSDGDASSIDVAAQLATARAERLRLEGEIAGIDRDLSDIAGKRKANGPAIENAGDKFKTTEASLRAALAAHLQSRLEPIAAEMAEILKFGYAVSRGLGGAFQQILNEARIPAADHWNLPLLANSRLRTAVQPKHAVAILDELWRDDPELLKLSEVLTDFSKTSRLIKAQSERAVHERMEALKADPAAWTAHQRELNEKRDADNAEHRKQLAEARAKSEREQEDRHARLVDKARRGEVSMVVEPGDLGTKELRERRERVAAEALRAEEALNARAADVDEPAAA